MPSDDVKAHSRERFSQFAQGYVNSPTHAQGDDLDRLLEIAAPQADWLACDIATGGGHTALKIAPHVRRMIATDYAPTMLRSARAFIQSQDAPNVDFVPADAETLPFADNSFDLITCRIAAHHFPDIFRFVQECGAGAQAGRALRRAGSRAAGGRESRRLHRSLRAPARPEPQPRAERLRMARRLPRRRADRRAHRAAGSPAPR